MELITYDDVKFFQSNIFKEHNFRSFDVIIDDGSHQLSDILSSLNSFFKFLNDEGMYVIEDYKHPNYYTYNKTFTVS